jgi:hypothetical protein
MAKYTIKQRVDYTARIEAGSEEEAMEIYLSNQQSYYDGVYSESVTSNEDEEI